MKGEITRKEEFDEIDLFADDDDLEGESSLTEDIIVTEEKEIQEENVHGENARYEEVREEGQEENIPEENMLKENVGEEDILEEPTIQEVPPAPTIKLDEVINSINDLSDKMNHMNKLFIGKIQHTEFEDKIVDQMHAELQKYKDDMYSRLVRPILLDIIEVRDSILRIAGIYADKPEGEQDIPNKMFADYALDIQDILEKNEIEIYQSSSDTPFAPVKQKAIKKIPTTAEHLHGKIAETMSSGYTYKGRTISPEKVAVYSYERSCEEKESED